jgi:hypothetical protein
LPLLLPCAETSLVLVPSLWQPCFVQILISFLHFGRHDGDEPMRLFYCIIITCYYILYRVGGTC